MRLSVFAKTLYLEGAFWICTIAVGIIGFGCVARWHIDPFFLVTGIWLLAVTTTLIVYWYLKEWRRVLEYKHETKEAEGK